MTQRLENYIGGAWRPSSAAQALNVLNPASAQVLAEVPLSSAAEPLLHHPPVCTPEQMSGSVTAPRETHKGFRPADKLLEGLLPSHRKGLPGHAVGRLADPVARHAPVERSPHGEGAGRPHHVVAARQRIEVLVEIDGQAHG